MYVKRRGRGLAQIQANAFDATKDGKGTREVQDESAETISGGVVDARGHEPSASDKAERGMVCLSHLQIATRRKWECDVLRNAEVAQEQAGILPKAERGQTLPAEAHGVNESGGGVEDGLGKAEGTRAEELRDRFGNIAFKRVGQIKTFGGKGTTSYKRETRIDVDKYNSGGSLGNDFDLVVPQVDAQAQYDSFKWHVENAMGNHYAVGEKTERIVEDVLEKIYDNARWSIPQGWTTRAHIRTTIGTMIASSALGYPLNQRWGATIGDFITNVGMDVAVELVWGHLQEYLQFGKVTTHPVAFFVKREGHSTKKAALKRWRLIWPSSFVGQVLQRIVWLPSVDAEKSAGSSTPAFGNGGVKKGNVNRMFFDLLSTRKKEDFKVMTRDLSSFDWTVTGKVVDLDRTARWRLVDNYDATDEDHVAFRSLFDHMYDITYSGQVMFSDGWVYEQQYPGIQRSGVLITYSMNSRQSVRLHQAIRYEQTGEVERCKIAVAGDDAFVREETETDEKIAGRVAAEYGHVFKEMLKGTLMNCGFCSQYMFWSDNHGIYVAVPSNIKKHLWNLKWHEGKEDVLEQQLESYLQNYAFADEAMKKGVPGYDRDWFLEFREMMAALGFRSPMSRTYYKSFIGVG